MTTDDAFEAALRAAGWEHRETWARGPGESDLQLWLHEEEGVLYSDLEKYRMLRAIFDAGVQAGRSINPGETDSD